MVVQLQEDIPRLSDLNSILKQDLQELWDANVFPSAVQACVSSSWSSTLVWRSCLIISERL